MTPRRTVGIALGLLLLPLAAGAQVQIIRQLPPTGENSAQAQWGPAAPTIETPSPAGVQLGGRLALGTSGGMNDQGTQILDAFIDSTLSLLLPLGGSSRILVTADAQRKPQLDGMDQEYKAGTTFAFQSWQADVGASFKQQDRSDPSSSSSDMVGDAHASLTLGFIPTLPIAASYSYQLLDQSQTDSLGQASPPKNQGSHQAQLKANGSLGSVAVDSNASFTDVTDYVAGVETTAFGGSLGVTAPVASALKVYATVTPKYGASTYAATGNSVASTSLDSDLGIIIPVSPPFSFKVAAGMVDLWSTQAGPSADPSVAPFTLTWKGIAGMEWKQDTGVSAAGNYTLGTTVGGPLTHTVDAFVAYHGPQEAFVKNLGTSGTWSLSVDSTGAPTDTHAGWNASANLGSQDALGLAASYTGSVDGLAQPSWNNAAQATFTHQVIPELAYNLGANLSSATGPSVTPTLNQSYLGKITFSPRIGDRTYAFGVDENLSLAALTVPTQVVSRAGAALQLPILSFLSTRYRLDWEWDAQTTPGAGPGSSFHHAFGLTLSGQPLPFSLTAEYALTHGFRGLRHDVNASLSVSIIKNLSLQGSFTLSAYQTGAVTSLPFLAMLTAAYQF